ncbi:c-type cytochrome [Alisedimentitalea sp. MJ-SS2]|uniref:c-type cytochrome n=1 Tax=Aliisedimentitalea sp. MJ-SS2 TaxID=3049795 RepID=UPI0029076AE0|nr:c-type cytochrome [Alisedimentitalea sp. MJ-SS2]MDU8928524.1 c-type cytochrome [Alisedimentitalea sp. MJ-SS2]
MRTKALTAILAAGLAFGAPALADETHTPADGWNKGGEEQDEALTLTPNLENGLYVYEVCSACHGLNGWGLTDGTFPQIAGQHAKVTIKQLADIRALNRDNPTMYPFAKPREIGGSQSIADVAAYIAKLPMNPEPGVGDGTDLELGAQLYADNCVKCHGDTGEGADEKFYPKIQGQHYNYLVRQYNWIKEGKRRNANPEMVEQIQRFTDKDTKAVLDYVSRLKPPADKIGEPGWVNPDFDW